MSEIAWPESQLGLQLAKLDQQYRAYRAPVFGGPFEMLLWEMVAYLADDAKRMQAFRSLRDEVGLKPEDILHASPETLNRIARIGGSIAFELRAQRMVEASILALNEFGGDLTVLLTLPSKQAIKKLTMFPMIGAPGAEKILLTSGVLPVLALDSNGLRVLVRLGYGEESKNYSGMYRSVREAVKDELPLDCALLTRAHHLLRVHGQENCRAGIPKCIECSVSTTCQFYRGPS